MTDDTQGWGVYTWEGEVHVAPVNEVHMHVRTDCRCGAYENADGVIVHPAFDGRDAYERGERKPS
jgi:hypothetical protein